MHKGNLGIAYKWSLHQCTGDLNSVLPQLWGCGLGLRSLHFIYTLCSYCCRTFIVKLLFVVPKLCYPSEWPNV